MKLSRIYGFTIVEVMIVVIVLGILASLVTVGFNSVQKDARDSQVKVGAQKIAEAIELWSLKTKMRPIDTGVGSGSSGTLVNNNGTQTCSPTRGGGAGWFGRGSYACTMEEALVQMGFLAPDFVSSQPVNKKYNTTRTTYMLYRCNANTNNYVLYMSLENPSSKDVNQYNEVAINKCRNGETHRTSYNMQSAIFIDLSQL